MLESINRVYLLGRLVKKPEERFTPSKTRVVNFIIACNRSRKDRESGEYVKECDFCPCVLWGSEGKRVMELSKGDTIAVLGELRPGKYNEQRQRFDMTTVFVKEVNYPCGRNSTERQAGEQSDETAQQTDEDSLLDELAGDLPDEPDIPF